MQKLGLRYTDCSFIKTLLKQFFSGPLIFHLFVVYIYKLSSPPPPPPPRLQCFFSFLTNDLVITYYHWQYCLFDHYKLCNVFKITFERKDNIFY